MVTCEQALLFGRAKQAARGLGKESLRRSLMNFHLSPLPPAFASPLACLSRVYFSRYPQMESLLAG